MKKEYEKLKEKFETFNILQIEQAVNEFVENLFESYYIQSIDIDKIWCSYGTWKSKAFVNDYTFGKELAAIIRKTLSGRITHDEDFVFDIENYKDRLKEAIFEAM